MSNVLDEEAESPKPPTVKVTPCASADHFTRGPVSGPDGKPLDWGNNLGTYTGPEAPPVKCESCAHAEYVSDQMAAQSAKVEQAQLLTKLNLSVAELDVLRSALGLQKGA